MRACAISPRAASLVGIPVRRTQFTTFAMCAAMVGVGGILAAMTIGMTYASAFTFTLMAFSGTVVLGRKGPVAAFFGGLLVGLAQTISQYWLPSGWAAGVPALLIILILASGRLPATSFSGARP